MGYAAEKAEGIAASAIALSSLKERNEFLNQACNGDARLREKVEALLATRSSEIDGDASTPLGVTHDQDLSTSASGGAQAGSDQSHRSRPQTGPGSIIGAYKVVEEIGAGGMGTVFLAEQQHPVRRSVALKVIKPGMDSKQVLARFESERQALALMNHHNIARVLDAGTTEAGLPFFVMELVRGMPITAYCEEHKLGLRQRLELLIPVCQAIQHAHQKGVIHRDIKPSNVLVAIHDGKPVPKVIDFGIAKAIGQRLTDRTLYTQVGQIIGTFEYMSPEQAELSGLDIDTRSDIYSLGVLLYEMLTGTTPVAHERVKTAGFDEVRRMIREEEPARPSTRLSDSLDTGEAKAARHQSGHRKFTSLLRRELDWIVMKALEKDRTRRYDTAAGLAYDIQRFLDDEPVMASPPSTAYRVQKFLRRNRAAVSTAALVAIVLVAAVGGTSWQAVRATLAEQRAIDARQEAEQHQREAEKQRVEADVHRQRAEAALEDAKRDQAIANAVNQFVNEDLLQVNPLLGEKKAEVDLRTVLDDAATEVGKRFADQPLVEAGIRLTIGNSYKALGDYARAAEHLTRARDLYRAESSSDARETLAASNALVENYVLAFDLDTAESLAKPTYSSALRALGSKDPVTLTATKNLGALLSRQTKFREADHLLNELLALCRKELGDKDRFTMDVAHSLAAIYLDQKRLGDAERLMREVLQSRREVLGKDHPSTLTTRMNLAMLYGEQKRFSNAQRELENTHAELEELLGRDHPVTLQNQQNLAWWLMEAREFDAIKAMRSDAITRFGPTHDFALALTTILAIGYVRGADEFTDVGIELLESAIDLCRQAPDDKTAFIVDAKGRLGEAYARKGDVEMARQLYRDVYESNLIELGLGHRLTFEVLEKLCNALSKLGQHDRAAAVAQEHLDLCRDEFGADHELTARAMRGVAECYEATDPSRSITLYESALQVLKERLSDDHWQFRVVADKLAHLLLEQGHFEKAALKFEALQSIYERNEEKGGMAGRTALALSECYIEQGRVDQADEALEAACRNFDSIASLPGRYFRKTLRESADRFVKRTEQAGHKPRVERWRERIYRLCDDDDLAEDSNGGDLADAAGDATDDDGAGQLESNESSSTR